MGIERPSESAGYNDGMQCNIDQRGRRVRFVYGLVMLAIGGLIIGLWAARNDSIWPWIIGLFAVASGLFGLFEARKGWCVVRAMGIKTKM